MWAARRDGLGIGDHVTVINRPFLMRPRASDWSELIDVIVEFVKQQEIVLVIIDPLANAWPVTDENDATQVIAALQPLRAINAAGAAVLLLHHTRKSEGSEGLASRGSSALPGYVDIVAELRRYDPARLDDRRRTLTGLSRYDETPTELVLGYEPEKGLTVIGTKREATAADRVSVALAVLAANPGLTPGEILEKWPADGGIPAPRERTLRADLERALNKGELACSGEGVKGDPYRYWARSDSIPARSASVGDA
jgi:hypothetical protein